MIFDKINTIFGIFKLLIYKVFYFNRINFKFPIKIKASTKFLIDKNSKISLGKNVKIRYNSILTAERGGKIFIGNNVFINDGAHITSLNNITISDDVHIGQNLLILDHDHDYKNNFSEFKTGEVVIGKNVWIGANVTILRGVKIGENSVIAANTLVNKDLGENTLLHEVKQKSTKDIKGGK